jgi:16S rRNA (cytosine967-C5)-methyltransferase
MSEDDIIELSKLQLRILNNASKYLKPAGILLYSTCTITEEENEEVIRNFLAENKNYRLENICSYLPNYFKSEDCGCESGYIKLFPNINNCDGFFLARLRREW